jgi:DNA-binding GntR family transcriptional regulator
LAERVASHPRGSSQERAYRYIKTRILDRRFPVSCRLRAQDLAQAMALSRTPVREALGRLEQEGLVSREGGWGFTVRGMSLADVADLFEVREALELRALSSAMRRLDARGLARLRSLLDDSSAALASGRPAESIRTARRFHYAIAQASGNALLSQMLDGLNERIHMVGLSIARRYPQRPAEVLQENLALLAAIEQADAARAARLLRAHIRRSHSLLLRGEVLPIESSTS